MRSSRCFPENEATSQWRGCSLPLGAFKPLPLGLTPRRVDRPGSTSGGSDPFHVWSVPAAPGQHHIEHGEEDAAERVMSQLPDLVPGGTARIPGAGGSMHAVVPPLRNTTSQVLPAGLSRAGSATNHIVATASPRTRIMSGTTGLGSLAGRSDRTRPYASPLTPSTAGLAADTYATSAVCSPCLCPVWGTPIGSPFRGVSTPRGFDTSSELGQFRVERTAPRSASSTDRARGPDSEAPPLIGAALEFAAGSLGVVHARQTPPRTCGQIAVGRQ